MRMVLRIAAATIAAIPGSAYALDLPAPLSVAELAEVRGGYLTADGLKLDFGVVMSTYIDGALLLRSTLNLNPGGASVATQIGDAPGVVPLSASREFPGLTGNGVVLPGAGGATAIVQDLSTRAIKNIVVNTANNRQITQTTGITVALPNLMQLQQAASGLRAISALGSGLNIQLLNSSSH